MSWEWLLWALPFLALLACPLMMIWMMWGKSGSGGKADVMSEASAAEEGGPPPSDAQKEIAELRARLARLEAERERDREESWRSG